MRKMEYFLVFITGMLSYPLLEIAWRGYTHITMAFAGGICLTAIYFISCRRSYAGLLPTAFLGAGVITAVELTFGLVFNVAAGMNIWDYSERPANFMGQICAEYVLLWFALCLAVVPVCRLIHRRLDARWGRYPKKSNWNLP